MSIKFKTAGAMKHDINQLPHKVFYSTEEETLYTDFQIWLSWYNSDDFKDYNGDFIAWFNDCLRYDIIRPIEAVTVLWISPGENDADVPLLIDGYSTEEIAREELVANKYEFDDGFLYGPLPMSVINLDECDEVTRDWLTDPANVYSGPSWDTILYGDVPADVLTIYPARNITN